MSEAEIRTTVYAASVSPLADPLIFRTAYGLVSSVRQQKVDRYRFDKDKYLSLGAELLLRHALHESGTEYDRIIRKTDPWGKPGIENTGFHYNLSHSGSWAICAISNAEVGCDIEQIRSADLQVALRYFCPEESDHIARQESAAEQDRLFYRYWTLKESFMKATGLGMNLPLNAFSIDLHPPLRVHQSLDRNGYSLTEFDRISGYCCAVCTVGDAVQAVLKVIDLPI